MGKNIFVVAFALLTVAACGDEPNFSFDQHGGGPEYKRALVQLIQNSDRIEATEHSSELDAFDPNIGESPIKQEIVYGRHTFDGGDRAFFIKTIESMDPKTQDSFSACDPAVHHTLKFFSKGALIDTMDVCFECSQVIWNGTKATPPWAIYSGLAMVIEHIGFSSKRDWSALAEKHIKG